MVTMKMEKSCNNTFGLFALLLFSALLAGPGNVLSAGVTPHTPDGLEILAK